MQIRSERPFIKEYYPALKEIAFENWDDPKVLSKIGYELQFRTKLNVYSLINKIKERLKELESECFRFPSTELKGHSGEMIIKDRQRKGLLLAVGYKTGMYGLHKEERREILDSLYTKEIPKNTAIKNINLWGKPKTGTRLKEVVYSLARFTKQEKVNPRGDYTTSISERESDLKYLKKKYYDNSRYDWIYPKT
jgi:hypothetical protein